MEIYAFYVCPKCGNDTFSPSADKERLSCCACGRSGPLADFRRALQRQRKKQDAACEGK
jgi:hypothetical protein